MGEDLRRRYSLLGLLAALRGVHAPTSEGEYDAARQRLAFQELFALQLKLLVQRSVAWCAAGRAGGRVTGRCRGCMPTCLPCSCCSAASCLTRACLRLPPTPTGGCRAGMGGKGTPVSTKGNALLDGARAALPFELTGGQQAALENILGQMRGWPPMSCLLQVRAGAQG